jgi:glyceraldehyde 3-phosphate dehydrogenase
MDIRMANVGINGFGRIGRMVLRAYYENLKKYDTIDIVCINDPSDKSSSAHLLKYDSVHGVFDADVMETDDGLEVNGRSIRMVSEESPERIDWAKYAVDVVLECSGRFTKKSDAERHIKSGAKRVIVSAPSDGADVTVVFGINHRNIKEQHKIISNGSCTTNCLAPISYVLNEHFGIECGFMTTIHAFTGDQKLVDTYHRDLRRARSASLSIIPSSTGAARAIGLVLPELKGKLEGTSVRVPTANVSMIDLACTLTRPASADEINYVMSQEAAGKLNGVLKYVNIPLVSCDFNHSNESAIFDSTGTTTLDSGKFCRVVSWYDNEFGFSNRMLDVAAFIHSGR